MDRTTLAQFRLLVAVARADGHLDEREIETLRQMLGARADAMESLLADDVDVQTELDLLSDEERRRLYQSAFALTHADGHAATAEVALLKQIVPDEGEEGTLQQVMGEVLDTVVPTRLLPIADPVQRDSEIIEDTMKYAFLAAVAGAMPLPGVGVLADLAVISIQTKLVHDIGQYCGHSLDRAAIRGFVVAAAGSTGLRIAINNLARFVPGWGSAVGATTSFASTYAIGMVAKHHFEGDRGLDTSELRGLFRDAAAEGRTRFESEKPGFDAARTEHLRNLEALADRLERGELTRAEYDEAVAQLIQR
ncbi:MAG: hypothetical protein KTR31_16740 [Myxococcales bacterium]|nr:hypothetical protein [Myxococcales bacterium]